MYWPFFFDRSRHYLRYLLNLKNHCIRKNHQFYNPFFVYNISLYIFLQILVLVCLIFKRVTDDEASRVFLYLQKISREWSLLNNITWSRVGAALADTTYGGYFIITFALFIGRLFGELPTRKRIAEYILLGLGTILFVVLGK